MIPKNILDCHIIDAINDNEINPAPNNRLSKKYWIKYDNKVYPAKYILSLANLYVNNEMLSWKLFKGGKETNDFLKSRGFEIIKI
jgi:hypothetical protein